MVSRHRSVSFFQEIRCNGMTSFMEFMKSRNIESRWVLAEKITWLLLFLLLPVRPGITSWVKVDLVMLQSSVKLDVNSFSF